MDVLQLVRPAPEHEAQVMAYRAEMLRNGDTLDGCARLEETERYADWIDFERRLRGAYGADYVDSEVFLALRASDGRLVGIIDYRHPLKGFLKAFGGNIGYSVRPSERGKGYAKEMLRLLLPICHSYGERAVMLCCDKANVASRRTIEANGGILESEFEDTVGLTRSGRILKYTIEC